MQLADCGRASSGGVGDQAGRLGKSGSRVGQRVDGGSCRLKEWVVGLVAYILT